MGWWPNRAFEGVSDFKHPLLDQSQWTPNIQVRFCHPSKNVKSERSFSPSYFTDPCVTLTNWVREWLTVGLCSWAVRVAEGEQGRLHQLREEDVLPDQHELCVLLSPVASLRRHASVRLLHHAEDGNHQTCAAEREEETAVRFLLMSGFNCAWSQNSWSITDVVDMWIRFVPAQACVGFVVFVFHCWVSSQCVVISGEHRICATVTLMFTDQQNQTHRDTLSKCAKQNFFFFFFS